MGKTWTTVFTNSIASNESKAEKTRRMQKASNMIKNTSVSTDSKERIKHCKDMDKIKKAEDKQLIEAYDAKKLKSKQLIRKAKALKKAAAEA